LFLSLFPLIKVAAQTYFSGGVPLSSNLGLRPGDKGTWQFNLSFDQDVLKTFKKGSNELKDNSRKRITRSILAEVSYGFTERIVVDVFMSCVNQERTITQFFAGLPIYAHVTGTQLAPTYRFNIGVFLVINKNNKKKNLKF